jgi:hypothetical protein
MFRIHRLHSSVVIHNFNVMSVPTLKPKAQTPTVIDANAPLATQISDQRFQTVGWGHAQIFNLNGSVKLRQPHRGAFDDVWWQAARLPCSKQALGFVTGKTLNHGPL